MLDGGKLLPSSNSDWSIVYATVSLDFIITPLSMMTGVHLARVWLCRYSLDYSSSGLIWRAVTDVNSLLPNFIMSEKYISPLQRIYSFRRPQLTSLTTD